MTRKAPDPCSRPALMAAQSFELPHGPADQCTVDMGGHSVKGRGVESTVVVDPTRDHRIKHPREVFDRFIALQLQPPPANLLTQRLRGGRCDRGGKVREETTVPIFTAPRTKGVTQEVELDVFMFLLSMNILAIDHLGLVGMKFQAAVLPSLRQSFLYIARLLQTATMDQSVIGVPAEG